MNDSDSELFLPGAEGKRRSPHFNPKPIVERTLVRAGLVEKYVLHCRGLEVRPREEASEPVSKKYPRRSLPLWSKAIPRDAGFHGLRHYADRRIMPIHLVVQRRLLREIRPVAAFRTRHNSRCRSSSAISPEEVRENAAEGESNRFIQIDCLLTLLADANPAHLVPLAKD